MSKEDSVLLVGLGAIGSILYARLKNKGYSVICLTSERGYKIINKNGLYVKLLKSDMKRFTPEVYYDLPKKFIFNRCIICTKSYNNKTVSTYLEPYLEENATLLLMQNGLNIERPFLNLSKDFVINRAITSMGATRINTDHIYEKGKGETEIGHINHKQKEKTSYWVELCNNIDLKTTYSPNIERSIWLKTIINCVINPLGALTGLTNGEIFQHKSLEKLSEKIILEILKVVPDNLNISLLETKKRILTVIELTKENKCSMLQDIQRGNKTEIGYLNAEIVHLGKEQSKNLPINAALTDLIQKLEKNKLTAEIALLELKKIL